MLVLFDLFLQSMESEGKKKLNGVEDAKKMVEQLIKYSKEDCLEPMRGEIADWKEKVEEAMSEVAARKVIIKVRLWKGTGSLEIN